MISPEEEKRYWGYLHDVGVRAGQADRIDRAYMETLPRMMLALTLISEGYVDYRLYKRYRASTVRYLESTDDEVLSCISSGDRNKR
jgi:hypothetical protein